MLSRDPDQVIAPSAMTEEQLVAAIEKPDERGASGAPALLPVDHQQLLPASCFLYAIYRVQFRLRRHTAARYGIRQIKSSGHAPRDSLQQ
jgi:hypothetical protein